MGFGKVFAKYGILRVGYMFIGLIFVVNLFGLIKMLITRKEDGKKLSKKEFQKSIITYSVGLAVTLLILIIGFNWFISGWA